MLLAGAVSAQQYFPDGVKRGDSYAIHLKALHEPSLWEQSRKNPKAEVYRFLWLRTFHHPIAVRVIVRTSGSAWIHSEMTSGHAGYEPGRLARYNISWMTKGKTQSFLSALQGTNFWNLPTDEVFPPNTVNLDGAHWIIEGIKDGTYHIIDRFSPDPADPVRVFGLLALRLARFRLHRNEIY